MRQGKPFSSNKLIKSMPQQKEQLLIKIQQLEMQSLQSRAQLILKILRSKMTTRNKLNP